MDRGHKVTQLFVPHLHQRKRTTIEKSIGLLKSLVYKGYVVLSGGKSHDHMPVPKRNPDYIRFSMTEEERLHKWEFQIAREALFNKFYDEYIPYFTKPCFTEKDIRSLGLKADLYIVGSDQVWNPEITKEQKKIFFFSFLPDNIKRISYAGCFGGSEKLDIGMEEKLEIKKLVQRFSGISVRDTIAKNILKNMFAVDSVQVLDPSFLLSASDYIRIAEKSDLDGHGCVFMNKFVINDRWLDAFQGFSRRRGLKLIANGEYLHLDGIDYSPLLPVEGWLKLLSTSDFIITDSFHCSVFCVIFKKQFITTPSYSGGEGRMISFLEELGLKDRYFYSSEDFIQNCSRCEKVIDYDMVYKVLDEKIRNSKKFLEKYLS